MSILKKTTKTTKTEKKTAPVKAEVVKSTGKGAVKPVIVAPRVTEKAAISQSQNKYTFLVERSATKAQVKRAVAAEYNVSVVAVNLINVQGKTKRSARGMGRRSDFKKAIVTLPKGTTITVHEGV